MIHISISVCTWEMNCFLVPSTTLELICLEERKLQKIFNVVIWDVYNSYLYCLGVINNVLYICGHKSFLIKKKNFLRQNKMCKLDHKIVR